MRALSDQATLDPYASPYALYPTPVDINGVSPRHLAKKLRPDSGDSFGTPTSGNATAQLPPFPGFSAAPLHGELFYPGALFLGMCNKFFKLCSSHGGHFASGDCISIQIIRLWDSRRIGA